MKFTKYLISTESYNNDYGLLYNTKNGYFIRYCKKNFNTDYELLEYPDIVNFLESRNFFGSENERLEIQILHRDAVASSGKMHLIIKVHNGCNLNCSYCYDKHINKK